MWQIASAMGLTMKKWPTNSQFELRESRALRQMPLHHLQALVREKYVIKINNIKSLDGVAVTHPGR